MERSWDKLDNYRGKLFEGQWPSICHMFLITVENFPDRPAFSIFHQKEKTTLTYKQVYQKVVDVASHLKTNGIKKGERIILNGKNSPAWAIAYLGILFAEATVVPLDNQMSIDRVDALSSFSEASGIFADVDVLQKLAPLSWLASQQLVVELDGPSFETIPTSNTLPNPSMLPSGDDIAAILYTSGTTGNEKGVLLTHANFTSDVYQASDPEFLRITEEDVMYALLPLHHSYCMTAVFLGALKHGCELLFGQGIVVSKVLHDMREAKVTVFLAIPLLYNKLLSGLMKKVKEKGAVAYAFIRILMWINGVQRKVFKINKGKVWFRPLLDGIGMLDNTICISGGGRLSPKTFLHYQQLGLNFVQGYGLTETAPILTLNPISRFKIKSEGKVFPLVDMRIADADLLGVGEVQVKGPNICLGYYKDPENTKALFTDDGYLKTGDLGFLDKDNYLYLKGRAKNLIVTEGGKNVYPEEIEDLFQHYGQIEQVLIRGFMANKSARAEGIEALIHPNADYYSQNGFTAAQIQNDVEQIVVEVNRKLTAYKKIAKITLVDEPMAMTSTKKIQRNKVGRTIDRLLGSK